MMTVTTTPACRLIARRGFRQLAVKVSITILLVISIVAVAPAQAVARFLPYHPNAHFSPGSGFDPLHPFDAKRMCLSGREEIELDFPDTKAQTSPALQTQFSMHEVRNHEELLSTLSISAALEGYYEMFEASASGSSSQETSSVENEISFVILAKSEFGRSVLKNPTIAEDMVDLLKKPNGPAQFISKCGSEFIYSVRRAVQVAIVFRFYEFHKAERSELRQEIDASFKAALWGVSGTASSLEFSKRVLNRTKIDVSVVTRGGPPISEFSPLIKEFSDLSKLREHLATYFSKANYAVSAPIAYTTASYSNLKGSPPLVEFSQIMENFEEITTLYNVASGARRAAAELLGSGILSDIQKVKYGDVYNKAKTTQGILKDRLLSCVTVAEKSRAAYSQGSSLYLRENRVRFEPVAGSPTERLTGPSKNITAAVLNSKDCQLDAATYGLIDDITVLEEPVSVTTWIDSYKEFPKRKLIVGVEGHGITSVCLFYRLDEMLRCEPVKYVGSLAQATSMVSLEEMSTDDLYSMALRIRFRNGYSVLRSLGLSSN